MSDSNEMIAECLRNYDDNAVDKLFDLIDWYDPNETVNAFRESEYSGDGLELTLQLAQFVITGQLAIMEESKQKVLEATNGK